MSLASPQERGLEAARLVPTQVGFAVVTHTAEDPGMSFGAFVAGAHARGERVIQPRMGFGSPALMREGLLATKRAAATTVGTITLDSYTRVGHADAVAAALREGAELNGYPIATYAPSTTRAMLDGVADGGFPVQVRHGSARPQGIFRALVQAGLHATEGGPVSYCLPYSRLPLRESVRNWGEAVRSLTRAGEVGPAPHMETFGGCLMGQLCPPSLLVAVSLLEAVFFRQQGIASVSLSYAQQTSLEQDVEAVVALKRLARELLGEGQWHVVVYAYMGLYPTSAQGALALMREAAELTVRTDAERLIVKTNAEARRIPTIAENIDAIEFASLATAAASRANDRPPGDTGVYAEARALIDEVLDLSDDVGEGLVRAFERGRIDVPYCLHPDNAGRSRSRLDEEGRLVWTSIGAMPLPGVGHAALSEEGSDDLLRSLSYVQRKFDEATSRVLDAPWPQPAELFGEEQAT